jgi:hypothetical protein
MRSGGSWGGKLTFSLKNKNMLKNLQREGNEINNKLKCTIDTCLYAFVAGEERREEMAL